MKETKANCGGGEEDEEGEDDDDDDDDNDDDDDDDDDDNNEDDDDKDGNKEQGQQECGASVPARGLSGEGQEPRILRPSLRDPAPLLVALTKCRA